MRSTFLMLFVAAANLFAAGPLILGGRGGTALNFQSNNTISNVADTALGQNFVIGPTVGLRLPLGLSVEGDALYNRRSLGYGLSGLSGLTRFDTHSEWWEFPVMLKLTPGNGPIAPVFGAGVTVQHISSFGSVPSYILTGRTSANSVGFVAGGGVQFRAGGLRVTPEIRYTRWNSGTWTQSLLDQVLGSQNQTQFLVGFTF